MKMLCAVLLVAVGMLVSPVRGEEAVEEVAAVEKADMANPRVEFVTSKGRIVVELFADKAPITVENILQYVDEGYYSDLIFHRIIDGFMVQGGGMGADMKPKANRGGIKNEADNGLKNKKGTLAMARTPDPHSASAQFFINLVDNVFLNYRSSTPNGFGYCVFGKVVEGMNVVESMAKVKTKNHGYQQNVPVEPIIIESASRVTPDES